MKYMQETQKNRKKTKTILEKQEEKEQIKKQDPDYTHCKRQETSKAEKNFKLALKRIPFAKLNYYKAYSFSLLNVFLGKYFLQKQKKIKISSQKSPKQNPSSNKIKINNFIHNSRQTLIKIVHILNKDPFSIDDLYLSKNQQYFQNQLMINYLIHSIEHGFNLWLNQQKKSTINQVQLRCFLIGSLLLMGSKFKYAEILPQNYDRLIEKLVEKNRFINEKSLNYLLKHWKLIISEVFQLLNKKILKNQQSNDSTSIQYLQQPDDDQEMNQYSYSDYNSESSRQFQLNYSSHGQVTPFLSSHFSSSPENIEFMIQGSMQKKSKKIQKKYKQKIKLQKQQKVESNSINNQQQMLLYHQKPQKKATSNPDNQNIDNQNIKQSLLEKNNYKRPKREEDKKPRRQKRPKKWKHQNSQLMILQKNQQQNQYQMAYSFAYYIYYAMKCTNINLSIQQNDFLWEDDNNMRNQEMDIFFIKK